MAQSKPIAANMTDDEIEDTYKRDTDFGDALKVGIAKDIEYVLRSKAGILHPDTQREISSAISRALCTRISDMFAIS